MWLLNSMTLFDCGDIVRFADSSKIPWYNEDHHFSNHLRPLVDGKVLMVVDRVIRGYINSKDIVVVEFNSSDWGYVSPTQYDRKPFCVGVWETDLVIDVPNMEFLKRQAEHNNLKGTKEFLKKCIEKSPQGCIV